MFPPQKNPELAILLSSFKTIEKRPMEGMKTTHHGQEYCYREAGTECGRPLQGADYLGDKTN
jgi:hypothetical protein